MTFLRLLLIVALNVTPFVSPYETVTIHFPNCDWVAECGEENGVYAIPCEGFCDSYIKCIDGEPFLKHCYRIWWLFWKPKGNFDPVTKRCSKDFNDCDWFRNASVAPSFSRKNKLEDIKSDLQEPRNNADGTQISDLKAGEEAALSGLKPVLNETVIWVTEAVKSGVNDALKLMEVGTGSFMKKMKKEFDNVLKLFKKRIDLEIRSAQASKKPRRETGDFLFDENSQIRSKEIFETDSKPLFDIEDGDVQLESYMYTNDGTNKAVISVLLVIASVAFLLVYN